VEAYVAANACAIAAIGERRRPELALVNHLVMGPLAAARAGARRAVRAGSSAGTASLPV